MRLRQALHIIFAGRPAFTPREAVDEAVLGERSGEVVVRAGDGVGHIDGAPPMLTRTSRSAKKVMIPARPSRVPPLRTLPA